MPPDPSPPRTTTPDSPPTAARRPTSQRREQIAGAVLRILGERGSAALTAAAVAAEVGLTSGALFRHFPTVTAMVEAAVDRAVATIEGTFPPPDLPALERLNALASRRIEALQSDRGLAWMLRSDEAHVFLSPRGLVRLAELVARSQAFLRTAIEEGQRDGSIRGDVPASALLAIVSGTTHGLSRSPGASSPGREREAVEPGDAVATTLAALSTLLSQGVAPVPPSPPRRPLPLSPTLPPRSPS